MPRPKLTQRADGRYRCKYQGRYFYGATQKEAYQKRDEYRRKIEAGMRAKAEGLTVKSYALRWVATYKAHLADASYDQCVRILNRFCAFEDIGERAMQDVDTIDIQNFYNTAQDMSHSYICDMRDTIKGLFLFALADRVILHDPTIKAKPPKGKKGTHRAITTQERDLIHRTQHRIRPAVMVMLYAGLRRGEALALDIDRDVDFIARTITVRHSVRYNPQGAPVIVSTKTEAGQRTVPLIGDLAEELRGLHGLLLQDVNGHMMSESSWARAWESYINALNCTHNGCQKRWYGRTKAHKQRIEQYEALTAAGRHIEAEQIKLPPWQDITIRPHDLRHSYCTMLYDVGIDVKTAQKWMGHADGEVTMQIYTHLTAEREKNAAERLENAIKSSAGGQNGGQSTSSHSQMLDIQAFAHTAI